MVRWRNVTVSLLSNSSTLTHCLANAAQIKKSGVKRAIGIEPANPAVRSRALRVETATNEHLSVRLGRNCPGGRQRFLTN